MGYIIPNHHSTFIFFNITFSNRYVNFTKIHCPPKDVWRHFCCIHFHYEHWYNTDGVTAQLPHHQMACPNMVNCWTFDTINQYYIKKCLYCLYLYTALMVPAREGCVTFHVVYMLYVCNLFCQNMDCCLMDNYFVCLTSDSLTTFDRA